MIPIVEARGMGRVLPGPLPVTLVENIDFRVMPGEFVAITGPSGSGKSSLLYLLGLLDVPSTGEVRLMGNPTAGLGQDELAALRLERIGFVFQFHFLLPEFTALANVAMPMRKQGILEDNAIREKAMGLLKALDIEGHARKLPDQLSGGQRQRVAIARALANNPSLVLADEPTGNLDSRTAGIVFSLFREVAHAERRSVVVVTHDQDLAAMADRRIHLVDGRIVDQ